MLKLSFIGNLGNDATVNEISSQEVINFSVACNIGSKDKKKTIWIACSKWCEKGKSGIAQHLKKGAKVYVEGLPVADTYEKEGETVATQKCTVKEIQMVQYVNESEPEF